MALLAPTYSLFPLCSGNYDHRVCFTMVSDSSADFCGAFELRPQLASDPSVLLAGRGGCKLAFRWYFGGDELDRDDLADAPSREVSESNATASRGCRLIELRAIEPYRPVVQLAIVRLGVYQTMMERLRSS